MEVDQIQCKFQTFGNGNGRLNATKVAQNRKMDDQYPDEEDDGEREQIPAGRGGGRIDLGGGVGRFYGWPSSRIVRVTRASGGKDRHSKVLTSKGLRDRRVRLSVNTAIQFYDLQDRLGYDQPSKAVEWLLKAAASSIAELPPMNPPFQDTPKQVSDEKRSSTAGSDQVGLGATADTAMDGCGGEPSYLQQVTKSSACSSNSETSKGSGLSLSRSEHRIKARERARERAAEKDKDKDQNEGCLVPSLNPNSQITSFTELLSGGFNNVVHNSNHETSNRQWSSPSMDYLTTGLLGAPGQMQFVNTLKRNPNPSPQFTVTGYFNSELQNLEFGTEGQMVNGDDNHENNGSSGSYNLNFGISSAGVAGFNRGTLQSNSSSSPLLPPVHSHRFGSSSTGFLMAENHPHEFQLFYGRNGGQKGKGKD